jgi:hypothetical protein
VTLKIIVYLGQVIYPIMLCVDCALEVFGFKKTEYSVSHIRSSVIQGFTV